MIASDVELLTASGGYYAGKVDIGGKKRRIELIDGNVNGTFNDRAPDASDCDRVKVEGDNVGALPGQDARSGRAVLPARSRPRRRVCQIAEGGERRAGSVRVPETISEFVAFGENGHFVRKPVKGEFTLAGGQIPHSGMDH